MSCDERESQIVLYALGALGPSEQKELRAHLESGCSRCRAFLADIESTVDQLFLTVSPVTPPPELKDRLLRRIAGRHSAATVRVSSDSRRTSWIRRSLELLAAAAIGSAITAAVLWPSIRRDRQTIASLREELARQQAEIRELRNAVRHDTEMIELLSSPAVQLVGLQGTPEQPHAKARVYWDQNQGAWHFFATDLRILPPGRTYELWLINSAQRKLPAGTFLVNEGGQGSLDAKSPPDAGHVLAVAVSEEPSGGSPQPTGPIQLLGEIR